MTDTPHPQIPGDLIECVEFHGHLCPGLVYGYRVAKESLNLLDIGKAPDEEVVTVSENDSCAVDGFQVLLGTTAGKGNLIIRNYGKNVYTVYSRKRRKGYRFSRIFDYEYNGGHKEEFDVLEKKTADRSATPAELSRQKFLKSLDLATKPIDRIFTVKEVEYEEIPYAPLAPSQACTECGELTMLTKMISLKNGDPVCIPCFKAKP
jgi:formylmethanofuran dehydrogenase subunit E